MGFGGSPDYLNQCSPAGTNGQSVPQNISGIQQARGDKRLVLVKAWQKRVLMRVHQKK